MTSIPVAICRFFDKNFKRDNLKKRKDFFWFFIGFLKCAWKWEHFEKKKEYPSLIINEIIESKRDVYLSA